MVLLGHRHAALVLFRTGRANRAGFPPSSQQIRDETHHQTGQPSACSESRPNQLFLLLLPPTLCMVHPAACFETAQLALRRSDK